MAGVYHKHLITSLPADPGNPGKVQPSYWAEEHVDSNGNAPPTWKVDSSNRATGLVSPDGATKRVDKTIRCKTALLAGDSIASIAEVVLSATSVVDNGDGTGTVVRTSHGAGPGDPIRIVGATTQSLNVMDSTVLTTADANTLTFQLGGRTHDVTSGSTPTLAYPLRRGCRGWFNWVETFLGVSFDTTWCAVGGAASGDISALIADTTFTETLDVGFVNIGMNDVYSNGDDFATCQANITTLLNTVRLLCNTMVVLTIPPRDSGGAFWSAGKQAIHTALNRWMYDYALSIGAIVIQTERATQDGATYVNGAATNPDPLASMTFDGTHPSMRGAMAIGQLIATQLSPIVGGSGWKPGHAYGIGANAGNIITDAAFATDSGGVATGWASSDTTTNMSVTPTCADRTVAADGDACGRNQILTVNYGTATGTASTRFRKNNIQALVTAGTTIQWFFPFSVTGAVGVTGIEMNIVGTRSSGLWLPFALNQDSNADVVTGAWSGSFITPKLVVPTNITDLDIWVRLFITSAQTTDVVLTLWEPELRIVI